jgi:hypothetical protein
MTTIEATQQITPGNTWGAGLDQCFYFLRVGLDGTYSVECGWAVQESFDDDYLSASYHPFKGGRAKPWVGRKMTGLTGEQAAQKFDEWKAAVLARRCPTDGDIIGSVTR